MKRKNRIYKWLVALWLLLSCQPTLCAYQPATQPSAWRTTPTMSTDNTPSYQFRSTSTYAPIVGHTSYMASEPYNPSQAHGPNRACKDYDPWGETDPSGDLGVGELDDPAPIGSPLVLLLMAVLYIFYIKSKKIREKFAYIRKKQ